MRIVTDGGEEASDENQKITGTVKRSSRDTSVVLGWALVFDGTLSQSSRFHSSSSCFAGGFSGTHRSAPGLWWWVLEEGQPVSASRLFGLQSETVPSEGSSHSKHATVTTQRGFQSYHNRLRATSTSNLLVPQSTGIGSQIILKHFVCFAYYIIRLTGSSTLFSRSRWPLNCLVYTVTFAGGLNLDWLIIIWMEFTCAALRSQSSWLFFKQSAG